LLSSFFCGAISFFYSTGAVPQKKEESKPLDMRAQIQSIVASIQPALQKAIGSNNLAKIQVIITDKEEEKKKDE
jgi:hypothetical protein